MSQCQRQTYFDKVHPLTNQEMNFVSNHERNTGESIFVFPLWVQDQVVARDSACERNAYAAVNYDDINHLRASIL